MGLKEDIKKVYEESIGGGSDNIEKLASGLEKAIENFIVNQTFTVKKLSATAVGVQGTTAPTTATGANAGGPVASVVAPTAVTVPTLTVEVDETGGVANPKGSVESLTSEVGLDKNKINRDYN